MSAPVSPADGRPRGWARALVRPDWHEPFLGAPWSEDGRTLAGIDCWGVVWLAYGALGIALPAYEAQLAGSCGLGRPATVAAAAQAELARGCWAPVAPAAALPLDLLLWLGTGGRPTHVSLWLARGRHLDIRRGEQVRVRSLSPDLPALVGAWRHEALA